MKKVLVVDGMMCAHCQMPCPERRWPPWTACRKRMVDLENKDGHCHPCAKEVADQVADGRCHRSGIYAAQLYGGMTEGTKFSDSKQDKRREGLAVCEG